MSSLGRSASFEMLWVYDHCKFVVLSVWGLTQDVRILTSEYSRQTKVGPRSERVKLSLIQILCLSDV